MKGLLIGLLALIASVVIALVVREDAGYILLSYGNWTVEGSLIFFLLLNLLLFVALYILIRTLVQVRHVPGNVHDWRAKRSLSKAQHALTQGLIELSEGRWQQAEKSLLRHIKQSETPLLNFLAAARAAQLQGAYDRRDNYLQQAHKSMPTADMAVGLTQAELQLAHKQYEQALATLTHLQSLSPRHAYVLKLLWKLYEDLGEWEKLHALLPELRKRRIESPEALQQLEVKISLELMHGIAKAGDGARLIGFFRDLPSGLRSNNEILETYIHTLVEAGDIDNAVSFLAELLPKAWKADLVLLYGTLKPKDSAKQLLTAETWLPQHQNDSILLLTLARLCMRNKLWGKARNYLEASIGIEPLAATYNELGALLEQMDEPDEALNCYRSGLALIAGNTLSLEKSAELPQLEQPQTGTEAQRAEA